MSLQEHLLNTLADGKFHSGEVLGESMGVSRAAVWKQLKKLDELGLSVESVKGKGYRLPGGLDLLDQNKINEYLSAENDFPPLALCICKSIDSTNAEVLRKLAGGEPSGCIVLAELQSEGRGRRGRDWVSPYGCNIYLTVGWRFESGAQALQGLTLALGVATISALEKMDIQGLKLKWPNDLLFQNKKVGGILVELEGDLAGECHCAIGIGLNVGMTESNFTHSIDRPWADLEEISGRRLSRNLLVAKLLSEWIAMIKNYESTGFSPYQKAWQKLDNFADQEVNLIVGNKSIAGVSRGVDREGNLQLWCNEEIKTFAGGEISLRPVGEKESS